MASGRNRNYQAMLEVPESENTLAYYKRHKITRVKSFTALTAQEINLKRRRIYKNFRLFQIPICQIKKQLIFNFKLSWVNDGTR